MIKILAVCACSMAAFVSLQSTPDAVFQKPYAPGEIERIIAANPTVEDLVRAMLVGDDPARVDALVDAIAGPDEAVMVMASR